MRLFAIVISFVGINASTTTPEPVDPRPSTDRRSRAHESTTDAVADAPSESVTGSGVHESTVDVVADGPSDSVIRLGSDETRIENNQVSRRGGRPVVRTRVTAATAEVVDTDSASGSAERFPGRSSPPNESQLQ